MSSAHARNWSRLRVWGRERVVVCVPARAGKGERSLRQRGEASALGREQIRPLSLFLLKTPSVRGTRAGLVAARGLRAVSRSRRRGRRVEVCVCVSCRGGCVFCCVVQRGEGELLVLSAVVSLSLSLQESARGYPASCRQGRQAAAALSLSLSHAHTQRNALDQRAKSCFCSA